MLVERINILTLLNSLYTLPIHSWVWYAIPGGGYSPILVGISVCPQRHFYPSSENDESAPDEKGKFSRLHYSWVLVALSSVDQQERLSHTMQSPCNEGFCDTYIHRRPPMSVGNSFRLCIAGLFVRIQNTSNAFLAISSSPTSSLMHFTPFRRRWTTCYRYVCFVSFLTQSKQGCQFSGKKWIGQIFS